ncbi:MAG TPA: ABC transporter substrate-binding protein [Acidimicrobiia bacterium]|nr:ABC transporter substrate-binding protein [Acidimicrobiia bacterium]
MAVTRARMLLALGLAGALTLAGCSSNDTTKTSAGIPDKGSASEAAAPAAPDTPATATSGDAGPTAAPTPSGEAGASTSQPGATAAANAKTASSAARAGAASPATGPGTAKHGAAGAPQAAPAPGAPAISSAPAGKGGATDVGVTDDEIKVGAIYMHGMQLASFMPKPMERLIEAQLRVMNDQGGIHGRKFKYIGCDDGVPDAARTRTCYKKLVEQDKIFAFLGGLTFNSGLIQPDIERDKVPALAPGSLYRSEWENPWSFAIHMGMEREAHAGGQWVVDVIKPKKIGLLCLNNAEMQATCDASAAVMKKAGIQVVHRVTTSAETPDMSGDVLAMRAAAPDHVIHYTTHPAATARFMLDASQQDYWPPKGMSGNHMAGEFAGALIGNYPAKHGYWTNTTYKLWGPELLSWTRKYLPDQEGLHNHVMQGQWWATNVFFDVLKKMGPNVTREGLKQALETGEYTTGPGLDQKFMWSPKGRSAPGTGARREFMYKAIHSDWAATKDAAATPAGLIPDPTRFVIEDTFD